MTDNEIIKALERTASWVCDECKFHGEMCDGDKCEKVVAENALDLIKRKDAEIERLKADKIIAERHEKDARELYKDVVIQLKTAKSEAIKEFIDKLKNRVVNKYEYTDIRVFKEIDNLVKEMTEVQE